MRKQVDVQEATIYIRELLAMSRDVLLSEAKFADKIRGNKIPIKEIIVYLFEKKFDGQVKDPTASRVMVIRRTDPFSFSPGKG